MLTILNYIIAGLEIAVLLLAARIMLGVCKNGSCKEKQDKPVIEKIGRGFLPVVGAPADTKLPIRGSSFAAGYDFYAPEEIIVPAYGRSELVYFNVKAYMGADEFLYMRIRSGLSTKHELMLETSGVIDSDYFGNPTTDGNIATVFRNNSDTDYVIKKGERCCQGIFMKYLLAGNDAALGVRRGGYGSTGK